MSIFQLPASTKQFCNRRKEQCDILIPSQLGLETPSHSEHATACRRIQITLGDTFPVIFPSTFNRIVMSIKRFLKTTSLIQLLGIVQGDLDTCVSEISLLCSPGFLQGHIIHSVLIFVVDPLRFLSKSSLLCVGQFPGA